MGYYFPPRHKDHKEKNTEPQWDLSTKEAASPNLPGISVTLRAHNHDL